jgi:phosphoribosylamine--glycine ligase
MQCKAAGHHVKLFLSKMKDGNWRDDGDGLVEKVRDWTLWMKWADLIVASDNAKYVHMLEPYRKYGYPIFGCPVAAVDWELDRAVGQKIFKDAGIEIMDSKEFKSYDDAISFVKKTMKRYVSKPNGDVDKALSYVSKSPRDMIAQLERWKKLSKLKAPFILQEFTPGVEMAVGGWFGKNGWNEAISENWEHKKVMTGDLFCNCGEAGTVLRYVKKSKLFDQVLAPLSNKLMDMGYTGYIDVAVIISEDGRPLPLEFSCRFGCPHFAITSALNRGDPAIWMADLLEGYDSLEFKENEISTGIVMMLPDFPFNTRPRKEIANMPIYCDKNKLIYPFELKLGTAPDEINGKIETVPTWVTTGTSPLVACGLGMTVSSSQKKAYENIKSIEIPNSPGYRIDIGDRLKKEIPILQKHGYGRDLVY